MLDLMIEIHDGLIGQLITDSNRQRIFRDLAGKENAVMSS
jgi:hypothetical protein